MTKRAKKIYEENCVYDYNEEICREFAENDDLREELWRDEGE
ncbi:hypothetical protein [Sulfolobus acidocaldarius]|nr:hypothetical protein [Sulfolobus acidocaldarius]